MLLGLEAWRPVDALSGRDAEPLADWLCGHPEVEVICRDRAGSYADGARTGALQALQVADGRHLWRNLGEVVDKTVAVHHVCVRAAFTTPPVTAESTGTLLVAEEPEAVPVEFVPPDDAAELKEIRTPCPELDATARHVRDFADMMRDLRGDRLPA
ncbi:hypothetical protein ACL02U_17395 [Streptomyces sp. MS06]|uniref:hypothetical protein n=1 Tax=Streptomyces sp. MS06 TaxID=3385974 RepID=UPI0039A19901